MTVISTHLPRPPLTKAFRVKDKFSSNICTNTELCPPYESSVCRGTLAKRDILLHL